jgi:hypothetical protein
VLLQLTLNLARPMSVPEEVVLRSGETTDAVRLPEELGGGFLAWAEVNHQLHCLNLIRKAIYWDYYVDKEHDFQRERDQVLGHLGQLFSAASFRITTNKIHQTIALKCSDRFLCVMRIPVFSCIIGSKEILRLFPTPTPGTSARTLTAFLNGRRTIRLPNMSICPSSQGPKSTMSNRERWYG